MKEMYSIWGMPSSPTYKSLESTIKKLANEHDSPAFAPHITVVGDTFLPKHQLEDAMSVATTLRPEALFKLGSIGYSQNFYKAIFIYTIEDHELRLLRDELLTSLSLDYEEYNPHMSLLYGVYAVSILRHIAINTAVPDSSVKIARLDLVPITPDPSEWEAIYSSPMSLNS